MTEEIIIKKEEELRLAMLGSDVEKLNELIDDSLVFTLPTGDLADKEMDLTAHKLGIQKLTKLECLRQKITVYNTFATVAAKMEVEGTFQDNSINGTYCYTRVWFNNGIDWKIVAGQVGVIL